MSSTRSTPAPSRSASRPGSGRSGPTPDRDRRQDLEADARTGRRPLHTLSAYAREQRLVLAQEVVDGKSNERALIPSLLDKLRLKGSLVTIDAAGSYRPIAERIVEADYLLTVKANQPKLLAGIKAALTHDAPDTVQRCESVETNYGPRNMALVQRIALNLIRRRPSGKDLLTVKRKKAGWSIAYLIETIAVVPD